MQDNGLFLTGGTGLLGLHWAQACKDRMPVTVSVHQRRVVPDGVRAVALDLADPHGLDAALQACKPRYVVHTAGLTNVERCEADPDRAHHENTYIAGQVAAAAARFGAQMVHISTDHLFADTATLYTEDDPVKPVNVYGRTKAAAEDAVLRACPNALVLRTNFYGWGPSYRPSFSDWILARLAQGDMVPLFEDVTYTPILIEPLIEAAMGLLDRQAQGIFNATGSQPMTKLAFGQAVAQVFDYDLSRLQPTQMSALKTLVRRPLNMALSNARLSAALGYDLGSVAQHLERLRTQQEHPRNQEIRAL